MAKSITPYDSKRIHKDGSVPGSGDLFHGVCSMKLETIYAIAHTGEKQSRRELISRFILLIGSVAMFSSRTNQHLLRLSVSSEDFFLFSYPAASDGNC